VLLSLSKDCDKIGQKLCCSVHSLALAAADGDKEEEEEENGKSGSVWLVGWQRIIMEDGRNLAGSKDQFVSVLDG
jgi:hypothetical protein